MNENIHDSIKKAIKTNEKNKKKKENIKDNENIQLLRNKKLKREVKKRKKIIDKKLNKFNNDSNPENIKYLNGRISDSFMRTCQDNSFCVFKSIDNILYLIYQNKQKSIISYNLIDNIVMNEIKNPHRYYYIDMLNHYFDEMNKRDLLLSFHDINIKLWNINNWELLLNFNTLSQIYSASFLNDNKIIYIILFCENEKTNIYDCKGNFIKKLNDFNTIVYFSDVYFDKKMDKTFILIGNKCFSKSYDYKQDKLYYKYSDINYNDPENTYVARPSLLINEKNKIIEFIESCWDGYIRIWNFHLGQLLNKIKIINGRLEGICLWNKRFLFVGCEDTFIKLIDLKKGLIVNELTKDKQGGYTLRKISIPNYGKCLLSMGGDKCNILIWTYKYV